MKIAWVIFVVFAVIIFTLGSVYLIKEDMDERRIACEAKGGVYLLEYKSRPLCIRADAVL